MGMLQLTKTTCQASLKATKEKTLRRNKFFLIFSVDCHSQGILTVTYCSAFQMPTANFYDHRTNFAYDSCIPCTMGSMKCSPYGVIAHEDVSFSYRAVFH